MTWQLAKADSWQPSAINSILENPTLQAATHHTESWQPSAINSTLESPTSVSTGTLATPGATWWYQYTMHPM